MSTSYFLPSVTGRIESSKSIPVHNIPPPYAESDVRKAFRASRMMQALIDIRDQYVRVIDPSPAPLSSDAALATVCALTPFFEPAPPEPIQGPMPCQRIIDLS